MVSTELFEVLGDSVWESALFVVKPSGVWHPTLPRTHGPCKTL